MLISSDGADILNNNGLIISSQEKSYTALNINDENDEYIKFGNDASINFDAGDDFTIFQWVKFPMLQTMFTLNKQSNTAPNIGYETRIASTGYFQVGFRNSSSNTLVVRTTNLLNTDTLYCLAFAIGGGNKAVNVDMYINKNKEVNSVFADTWSGASIINTDELQFGMRGSSVFPFKGYMYKSIIVGRKVTQTDVDTVVNFGIQQGNPNISNIISTIDYQTLNPIDENGINNGTSILQDANNIITEVLDIPNNKALTITQF